MMKKTIILAVVSSLFSFSLLAQSARLTGKVLSTDGTPVEGAILSTSDGTASAVTEKDGTFQLTLAKEKGTLKIDAQGFYEKEFPLKANVIPPKIVLVPDMEVKYNGLIQLPFNTVSRENKSVSSVGVEKKDMNKGFTIDQAIQDEIPGLQVIRKSGMPGEGAWLNMRGLHSIIADNNPLLVVNGIPYLGNDKISNTINGYSRGMLFGYNTEDIRNVTVLKGADAAYYGSLGSNGVILIETQQATSDNLETRISFTSQYGVSIPNKTIPVLGASDYKTYLEDIGMTRYSMISAFHTDYPFLENSSNYYSYLFNNHTNWINEVQDPTFVADNVFRVEGGDEIAKYNISFGYQSEGGVLGKTRTDKYHTLINANIQVSRKIDIFTNVGLSYITSNLQEQGMVPATNALLASSFAMPVLSPYKKDDEGNLLTGYSTYNGWNVNSNPTYSYDNVSNPLAIVNTIDATDKVSDANIRLGLNYRIDPYLTLTGQMNLYYDYTEESIFIPGVTDQAIIPQYYNSGLNTVRKGVIQNMSNFYSLNAAYNRTFNNIHQLNASTGIRYIGRSINYDIASGYNTANDYYQTLGSVVDEKGITGSDNDWKWLNYILHADYLYNQLIKATVNLSVDGTSVSGVNTSRFGVFPSAGLTFMTANTGILADCINLLNVTAEVSKTGNSRFSSNYGKNYYRNSNFFNLGTIIRSNVPNTKLQWEKKNQIDVGFDLSMFDNKVNLQANLYSADSYDLLIPRAISSVYGSSQYFDNVGEIKTNGMEIALRLNPVHTKDYDWMIGGSVSTAASTVESLGKSTELATTFEAYNNDDAIVLLRKGESPYQFYGYKTNGVYSTSEEAAGAKLTNVSGEAYQAGDVRFVDKNEDGVINEKDKYLLGSATPDFFGNLNTSIRYKRVSLLAEFGYSVGNKAYNAVRRNLESMSTFYNQSSSVLNRWQMEGQQT
ncbi:MAG: SusC/RagA family TonB-linked outer membrane protein, partial [Bacteroidota bacterium]|nr:SusC/RagA family TonB-linked outer membrane protein [Bacteroidota bacterium]